MTKVDYTEHVKGWGIDPMIRHWFNFSEQESQCQCMTDIDRTVSENPDAHWRGQEVDINLILTEGECSGSANEVWWHYIDCLSDLVSNHHNYMVHLPCQFKASCRRCMGLQSMIALSRRQFNLYLRKQIQCYLVDLGQRKLIAHWYGSCLYIGAMKRQQTSPGLLIWRSPLSSCQLNEALKVWGPTVLLDQLIKHYSLLSQWIYYERSECLVLGLFWVGSLSNFGVVLRAGPVKNWGITVLKKIY